MPITPPHGTPKSMQGYGTLQTLGALYLYKALESCKIQRSLKVTRLHLEVGVSSGSPRQQMGAHAARHRKIHCP